MDDDKMESKSEGSPLNVMMGCEQDEDVLNVS